MKYPKEVQDRVDLLDKYKENPELNNFNTIHMYPKNLAYPDGFYDSRFFNTIGFNWDKMEKRDLGRHDRLDFEDGVAIKHVGIYADGSTWITFKQPAKIMMNGQVLEFC